MFFVLLAYWCPIWMVYWRLIIGFPNSFQFHPLIPAPEEIRTTAIPQNPSTWRALEHLAVLSLWGNLRRGDSDRRNTAAMPAMRVNWMIFGKDPEWYTVTEYHGTKMCTVYNSITTTFQLYHYDSPGGMLSGNTRFRPSFASVNDPISLILNPNGHKQVYIPHKTVVSGGCLILMALFLCHDVHCTYVFRALETLLSVLRLLHGFTIITIILL